MYCECFNNDGYCGKDCTCENCKNQPENDKLRAEAILYLKNKYPEIKRKVFLFFIIIVGKSIKINI
jgi:hypothetical protein